MQDWNFILWFILGAISFFAGGVSGAAFKLMDTQLRPLPKPLPTPWSIGFSLDDGWFLGVVVPLIFYVIVKIASRPPRPTPGGLG